MRRLTIVLLLVLFPAAASAATWQVGEPPKLNKSINVIEGTKNSDRLIGTAAKDRIFGYRGWDIINGRAGEDWLYGGKGGDTIKGGRGSDRIFPGPGFDTVKDGPGNDSIFNRSGGVTLYNGRGDDIFVDKNGESAINGGPGNDIYIGKALQLNLKDDTGRDRASFDVAELEDGPGRDYYRVAIKLEGNLTGGDTVDSRKNFALVNIDGDGGNNTYQGGPGIEEVLDVGSGSKFYGRGSNDYFSSIGQGARLNRAHGGSGNDELFAFGNERVVFKGGPGNDRIEALSSKNAVLRGGPGADKFYVLDVDSAEIILGSGTDEILIKQESQGTLDARDGEIDEIVCIDSPEMIVDADPEDNVFGCTLAP
jgi:Ca2+-binding RTX toxin-like protein